MSTPDDLRPIRAAIVLAAIAFLGVLVLPPLFATPDEAKYIGLGLNILDGRGLVTDFGARFLNHSPVWPLLLAAPERYLGLDALAVGHVLNAIAGAATILLASALAWRVRPMAGALTAIALLAFPYLSDNARTAGLDLPAAALTLAFLVVALRALDRGSRGFGLLAGVLFGLGCLVKETALPFLPVPFLVALLGGVSLVVVARVAAASLLTAAITTSWWFATVAILGGKVYRLGTPAWTLAPIAIGVLVLIVIGWNAARLASMPSTERRVASLPAAVRTRWRAVVAWGGLAAWFIGQLVLYARTPKLQGESLFRPAQYLADIREFGPQLSVAIGFGVVGAVFALVLVRRSQGVRELLFASIAGLPLVLLVLAIGETPRHYLASLAILVALGAAGWAVAYDRARGDRRWAVAFVGALAIGTGVAILTPRTPVQVAILLAVAAGAATWAGGRLRTHGASATAVALGVLLASAGIVFVAAGVSKSVDGERARADAVGAVADWVQTSVEPGATVAVSQALAYEIASRIDRDHPVVRILPSLGLLDDEAPLGLVRSNRRPITDPLRLDMTLRNVDQLGVFSASVLGRRLETTRPAVWIDAEYLAPGEDTAPTQAMLDATEGIRAVRGWSYPLASGSLSVVAYEVDPDAVVFDQSRVFANAASIEALARLFRESGASSAAAALAPRIVVTPDTPAGRAALAELAALGAAEGVPHPSPSGP